MWRKERDKKKQNKTFRFFKWPIENWAEIFLNSIFIYFGQFIFLILSET